MLKHRVSSVLALGAAIALAVVVLGTTTLAAQDQTPDQEIGLEAANRVDLITPVEAFFGDCVPMTAAVDPRSGSLPITYTFEGMGQRFFGLGGYSYSTCLTALSAGRQAITVTATQGQLTFTKTNTITVNAPAGVKIFAPAEARMNEVITPTAKMISWYGTMPVTRTWTISGYPDPLVKVGGYVDSITATWTSFGLKGVAVEACVLQLCYTDAVTITVPPPRLTVSWLPKQGVSPMWADNLTLKINRPLVHGETVSVTLAGDPEWTTPFQITQELTTFWVFYDNTEYPCGRILEYRIAEAFGAQIVEPGLVRLSTPGEAGSGGVCRLYLPIVEYQSPWTPTPTLTPTPTVTATPTPTATATPDPRWTRTRTPTRTPRH